MDIELEFKQSSEYLNYIINEIAEKNDFWYHQKIKVEVRTDAITGHGKLVKIPKPNCKCGVGKIFFETDDYFFTRQYNGILYTKEQYFKNKEHNAMVTAGLYCAPYFGCEKKFKELNK